MSLLLAAGCACDDEQGSPGSQSTAIVVIDENDVPSSSGGTPVPTPSATPPIGAIDNCVVGGGAGDYTSQGGGITPGGNLGNLPPHGDLVFDRLEALLDGAGLAGKTSGRIGGQSDAFVEDRLRSWRAGKDEAGRGNKVFLIGVDTQGYKTSEVTANIRQVVHDIGNNLGIRRIVLNLSFVIMPCAIEMKDPQAFLQQLQSMASNPHDPALKEFQTLLADLARQSPSPDELRRILTGPEYTAMLLQYVYNEKDPPARLLSINDPLQAELDRFAKLENPKVIAVAAAGNLGNPYPFLPAGYRSVLSVTANLTGKQSYANAGEVREDDTSPLQGYIGTSFAAPVVAFMMARFLYATGESKCSNQTSGPPYKYATIESSSATGRNYLNGRFADLGMYCANSGQSFIDDKSYFYR